MSDSSQKGQELAAGVGKALFDAPMGDMIMSMGVAIAQAQQALDLNSIKVAQMMTGEYVDEKGEKVSTLVNFDGEMISLMELGFTPSFYQFVETTIELKMSVSMNANVEQSAGVSSTNLDMSAKAGWSPFAAGGSAKMCCTSVNANYANKYGYSAEGASVLRTRLVPVPPPALLEERIRRSLDRKFARRK